MSISTNNVWPNYNANNVQTAAKKDGEKTLGKDEFLKILVTQLRYQDPMSPLQDREFIAQMAQFSSVEQLMNMSGELALLRQSLGSASSMIGKTIEWYEKDSAGKETLVSGVVDSITIKDGKQYATSGSMKVNVDDIVSIKMTAEQPQSEQPQPEQPQTPEAEDQQPSDSGAQTTQQAAEEGGVVAG
ncbi:flagellar hook capping FlgD N-terminal domain-containing protein [Paenibacillus sp. SYP-B4298]|uniref:flagellar hook capping FlgD N-terminal domain-containing protein n=1 Tax=Paenibacillus sp. SYP-B4298 TaxID=2996034 RepID=UPI0022DD0865|nr:flagellar hook capping FlgD N-terminal domain-containing protein [Paenibacillus sp. SYP-B4298]